jgi:hypothetical protein
MKMTTKNKKPGRVIVARPDQLFVDLDGLEEYGRANAVRQLYAFRKNGFKFWRRFKFARSRSRDHWHLIVTLKRRMPAMERLALQCILGDDPSRARMNYCRIKNRAPWPILLIRPSKSAGVSARRKSARAKNRARNARAVARFMRRLIRTDARD